MRALLIMCWLLVVGGLFTAAQSGAANRAEDAARHAPERALVAEADFAPVLAPAPGKERVHVASFRLDRSPVTNGQFLEFLRAHPQWRRDRVPGLFADGEYLSHWAAADRLGEQVLPQQPVTRVSWFAARAYCAAAGGRLPSWYEWELTAAADEKAADARSSEAWRTRILDWYARPAGEPLPVVNTGAANIYGVSDLHGLVWEWVEDFGSLMVSGDSRVQGDPDKLAFCGAGALSAQDRDNYPILMRIAYLSALQARSTGRVLGFRCAADLPGESLYQLDVPLQSSDGGRIALSEMRGRPLLITLFYSQCSSVCPMITARLQSIESQITPGDRRNVTILMISLDAQRDTPQTLATFRQEHHIEGQSWIVARAGAEDVRALAAVLGVRYRELPDHSFNHSAVIALVDRDGVIKARADGVQGADAAFVKQVQSIATAR
ncbi:MAG TPA: SUMF1/EgtB/PvdO family nonheme iron enzyme [Steroidobacteraceae bacterium]